MAQVATLRTDSVRKLLGIPLRLDVTKTPAITAGVKKTDKKKGFFQQAKECQWCNVYKLVIVQLIVYFDLQ